jgi:ribonuclease P protein component
MNFKFSKPERLSSKIEIDQLFADGKNIKIGKLLFKFIVKEEAAWPHVQYLIVVPKRRVKKAVDRNRIKRQLREVIRLNKTKTPLVANKRLLLSVIYQGSENVEYSRLEHDFLEALNALDASINKN